MAKRALIPAIVPQTYAELRLAVELTLFKGRQAVELARLRCYHETGRLIQEHVLLFKDRADYGAGTIQRLAADLKTHRSQLQRCVQFYQAVPNCASRRNLTWTHYRVLLPVADAKLRNALAAEADRHEWTVEKLTARIQEVAPALEVEAVAIPVDGPMDMLKPRRGTPGLHLIVARGDALAVDLGFKLYWALQAGAARLRPYQAGDIVRIASDDSIRLTPDATKAELFTYAASLRRVVDGDTLVVELEVSPGVFIEQKLRLRGLDCPEMSTPEGRAAKRFVDALVAKTTAIVINTSKPDKYDRYLADVFLTTDAGEVFLNNTLLENGHAVRKDAWEFGDWGFE
jgi:endonuclease YncB( thermonuclease family)